MPIHLSYPNGGRILLIHPPPASDDPEVHRIYTHPLILTYLPFWTPNQTLDQVSQRRELRLSEPASFRDFRIHHLHPNDAESESFQPQPQPRQAPDPNHPRLIGTVGYIFTDQQNNASELGIIIAPELHQAGYASEAIYLLLEHGFTSTEDGGMGLNRVQFTTAAMNAPMRRCLEEKVEAANELTMREAWKSGEVYIDAVRYSILRREWFEGGVKGRLAERVEKAIMRSRTGTASNRDAEVQVR